MPARSALLSNSLCGHLSPSARESLAVKDHHADYRRISAHSITINRPIVGLTRQHDLPPTNSLCSTITLCYADPVLKIQSLLFILTTLVHLHAEKPFDFRNNHLLKGSQLALSSPSAKTKLKTEIGGLLF